MHRGIKFNSPYFVLFHRIRQLYRPITSVTVVCRISSFIYFWPKLTHPTTPFLCDSWATCFYSELAEWCLALPRDLGWNLRRWTAPLNITGSKWANFWRIFSSCCICVAVVSNFSNLTEICNKLVKRRFCSICHCLRYTSAFDAMNFEKHCRSERPQVAMQHCYLLCLMLTSYLQKYFQHRCFVGCQWYAICKVPQILMTSEMSYTNTTSWSSLTPK